MESINLTRQVKHLFTALAFLFSAIAYGQKEFTPNVMGPLWLETPQQWQAFDKNLKWAKSIGIRAVTIDVWWGVAEKEGDQRFEWGYYDRIFEMIDQNNLRIIPIMSFHQCGGNVNDDCNIPIPSWLWTHFEGHNPQDLMYRSEQGNYSREYLSLWANHLAVPQYIEFMEAFEKKYSHMADKFDELNISMGPAGEIRLPSYNQHDTDTNYPTRGAWQVYGKAATVDFQQFLASKYRNVERLNYLWLTDYNSFKEVEVPMPESCNHFQCDDAIDWFHSALMQHGEQILTAGDKAFSGAFKNIPLGFKIPGIHWLMAKKGKWHRAAEIATGLLPANVENDFGYSDVIQLAKLPLQNNRKILLHFTTLEMSNNPNPPAYSLANTLVSEFTKEANRLGVEVKGENSLDSGILHSHGWKNITDHFAQDRFTGITVLRLHAVASEAGRDHYKAFIERFDNK